MAGIIARRAASGRYYGVAPDAQLIGVKVADDLGNTTEGDLIQGMQCVYDNRIKYNIRLVNISLTGTAEMSYLTSPLDAAVERLWRAGFSWWSPATLAWNSTYWEATYWEATYAELATYDNLD